MFGWSAVEGIDWACLSHAYGPATDTPGHLRGLTSDDAEVRQAAMEHVDSAVVHQYSSWPVTSSALRVIADVMRKVVEQDDSTPLPDLEDLLSVFMEIAEGANQAADRGVTTYSPLTWSQVQVTPADVAARHSTLRGEPQVYDEEAIGRLWEWSMSDLFAVLAELIDVVLPLLDHRDIEIRAWATDLVTELGRSPRASAQVPALIELLGERVASATERHDRVTLVIDIGRLGGDTSPWLDDADQAVRACSALYVSTPEATREIIAALANPDCYPVWFAEVSYSIGGMRHQLLTNLLHRVADLSEILPAAVTTIATGSTLSPEQDWGLLLRVAFPDVEFTPGVQPPPPTSLNHVQRALLQALVANDSLWTPNATSAHGARMRVGLPHTQDELRSLVDGLDRRSRRPWNRAKAVWARPRQSSAGGLPAPKCRCLRCWAPVRGQG